jgi:hypothetical protein
VDVILIRPVWLSLLLLMPAQPDSMVKAVSRPNHLMLGEWKKHIAFLSGKVMVGVVAIQQPSPKKSPPVDLVGRRRLKTRNKFRAQKIAVNCRPTLLPTPFRL